MSSSIPGNSGIGLALGVLDAAPGAAEAVLLPLLHAGVAGEQTLRAEDGFQGGFDAAYIMTQGGPDYSTTTMDYYIYQHAYEFSHLGHAATAAWLLFMMVLAASAIFWRVARQRVHY